MPKFLIGLGASFAVALATISVSSDIYAADLGVQRNAGHRIAAANVNCQELLRCGPDGCSTYRVCARPCPDGYSCAPLYGAYGPYGGVSYWGGYTDSGWNYYR